MRGNEPARDRSISEGVPAGELLRRLAVAFAVGLAALAAGAAAAAETLVFTGATVHPVSGPPIADAVLVVEGSTIAGLGAEMPVPGDAEVVDLAGLHVYPSLIHPYSALGLTEISSVRGTVDHTEIGDVNSNLRAESAFHGDSELLPVAMSGGILVAHVVPRGGVFNGTSAVMRMAGWNWRDMAVEAPVAMHLTYPNFQPRRGRFGRAPSADEVKKEKDRVLELINETMADARAYDRARQAAEAGSSPAADFDPRLEALRPVVAGALPLFVHARSKAQIDSALEWLEEQGLENAVLVTGPDAQHSAEQIAGRGIPVLLNGVHELPARTWEPYDAAYVAAARLHQAGVKFAIGDGGGGFDAGHARNLPFHAAMAAAFGLPKEEALAAVTLSAAEILGVDDRLGSLETGKEATFIVTDGDPLEIRTRIERAWMAGKEIDLSADRQKRLYEKYRNRPRPLAGDSATAPPQPPADEDPS